MSKQQSGFTLIELIAVIVILGILAVTAIPRFVDMSDAARDATTQAMGGALAAAASLNHASTVASDAGLTAATPAPVTIANCSDVPALLDGGGLPTEYVVQAAAIADGASATCTVAFDLDEDGTYAATDLPSTTFTAYGDTP